MKKIMTIFSKSWHALIPSRSKQRKAIKLDYQTQIASCKTKFKQQIMILLQTQPKNDPAILKLKADFRLMMKKLQKQRKAALKQIPSTSFIANYYCNMATLIKQKCSKTKSKIKDISVNFGFKSWVSLSYPYLFLMVFLIILPLLIVILYSLIAPAREVWIFQFTFKNFSNFFAENSFIVVLLNSIFYSFFASVIAVIFAYPIAYIMAFKVNKLIAKNIWIMVTLPIWINILLKTIGLEIIFNLISEDILIGSAIGIILAMVYMFLPLVILPIFNALEKTDRNLLEASQDLGASATRTFWKITFRYSLPGVFAGFTLMMLSAMTSLAVVKYIGGGKRRLIANVIESYFYKGANFTMGAAISVILAVIVFIIIFSLKILGRWASGKKIWG